MPTVVFPLVKFETEGLKPLEQQMLAMLITLLERGMFLEERLRAAGLPDSEIDAATRRAVAERIVAFMVEAFPDQVFGIETYVSEDPPSART